MSNKTDIFEPSDMPYVYPHLLQFTDAIWSSFWSPKHFTYDRDVRDFKMELTDLEREIVKKCILSIGVVENKVKTFWGRLEQRMPKTEIAAVGAVFTGNEEVHRQTYVKLLEDLGLQDEFKKVYEIPCMADRVDYLTKYLKGVRSRSNKEFTKSLILFTLLVENCSLFSQFLVMSSLCKYSNVLKNFSDIINATAREEVLHGKFGAALVNIIKAENPDWFDDDMEAKIRRSIRKAYTSEVKVLDWIFENGELNCISKDEVLTFLKMRLNDSLSQMGYSAEFELDPKLLEKSEFFTAEIASTIDIDFFVGKSSDYNVGKAFNDDDLWG